MKLKGTNSKKLKDEDRKKKEKTLKRMEKARVEDNDNLRDKLDNKLVILEAEHEKAKGIIENYKKNIIELEKLVLKLDGAIVSLKEVVAE